MGSTASLAAALVRQTTGLTPSEPVDVERELTHGGDPLAIDIIRRPGLQIWRQPVMGGADKPDELSLVANEHHVL